MAIGILAYGSLIDEPGEELGRFVKERIACQTPFQVEYARISKSRDFAPTLIPVESEGSTVNAYILILESTVTLNEAKDMLWRRETRKRELPYKPRLKPSVNVVQILEIKHFHGVDTVIYTSIGKNLALNSPAILAKLSIDSILSNAGERKTDGVRYLFNAKKNGIITPNTKEYEKCILETTQTKSLEEAIDKLDQARPKHLSKKKDLDNFEKTIIEIADLICQYGFDKTVPASVNPKDIPTLLEKNKELFIKNCHEGFKKGQKQILQLMLDYEVKRIESEDNIKVLRQRKEKALVKDVLEEIKIIKWKEDILRHLIDTAAWQMIGGQVYVTRRLYQGVGGVKRLIMSNIHSVIAAADEFNKVESDFALITDLSSYIQTGDILLKKGDGSLAFVEVKEGKKNHEILNVLSRIIDTKSDTPVEEIMKSVRWDKKSLEQFERNLNQFTKTLNLTSVLNNDEGIDSSGQSIKIITPQEETPRFESELRNLNNELQKNTLYAYNVIDSCLHIGMYNGPLRFMGQNILKVIGEHSGDNILIVNFIQVVKSLHKPLLMLPFPKTFLFDILFGRTVLNFMLDIDKYMNLFAAFGMEAKWISKKETMKVVENRKNSGIFIYKGRGIKISSQSTEEEMFLSDGLLTKIFFEHIYPSYTAFSCRYLLGVEKGK